MHGKSSKYLVLLIVVLSSICPQITLAQNNQNFAVSLNAIPTPSLDELRYLDNVIAFMNGVEGFHPVSSVPGCAAKQAHSCVPFAGRNWFPLSRRAQIACGTFGNFFTVDDRTTCKGEMDWNIEIILSPPFSDLGRIGTQIRPITAEVTPDETLFNTRWFPQGTHSILELQNICVSGPHVRDEHHNNAREIHPAQVIWWNEDGPATNIKIHHLLAVQNDNGFFDDNGDFDCPGIGDNLPAGFKAWGRAPINVTFKIAFLIIPPKNQAQALLFTPMRIRLSELLGRHIVTSSHSESADSDDGTQHVLEINGRKVIIVDELQGNDEDIGVQFVEIRKRANGAVQGYVQVSTVVGRNDVSDKGGYHLITAEVTPSAGGIGLNAGVGTFEVCEPEKAKIANLRGSLKASDSKGPQLKEVRTAKRRLLRQLSNAELVLQRCLRRS